MQLANLAFAQARLRASNVSISLSYSRDRSVCTSFSLSGLTLPPYGSLRKPTATRGHCPQLPERLNGINTSIGLDRACTEEYRIVVALTPGQDNERSIWFDSEIMNNE